MIKATVNILSDLLHLVYPELCGACAKPLKKGEDVICVFCQHFLPKTDFHQLKDNPVEKYFWGRVNIESAASYLYFQKGGTKVQHLIHELKYKGKREIGVKLGKLFGESLRDEKRFSKIDLIIPVPLYWKKEKLRGYNQSDVIAQGISEAMEKPWFGNILERMVDSGTQTRKARMQRWKNVSNMFKVKYPHKLENKHILLVDDVVTTGATLEACAAELLKLTNTKVSIATIAFAQ